MMKRNILAFLRTFLFAAFVPALSLSIVSCGSKKVKAVDLGLSVKWASCNLGAESPVDYGSYFPWGETTTKSDYSESSNTTYGLSISELESRGIIDSDNNLTASYDAAMANWGNDWRMPTQDEVKELVLDCTWSWTTKNGVCGYKVTGPNGNSIFLPAVGERFGTEVSRRDLCGLYWSGTLRERNSDKAYYLYFDSGNRDCYYSGGYRYYGFAVRPVSE